jgi:hypothetical protein
VKTSQLYHLSLGVTFSGFFGGFRQHNFKKRKKSGQVHLLGGGFKMKFFIL